MGGHASTLRGSLGTALVTSSADRGSAIAAVSGSLELGIEVFEARPVTRRPAGKPGEDGAW